MMNNDDQKKTHGGKGVQRLLLVEDDDLVRVVLARGLKLYHYNITIAASGAEAVTQCQALTEPFDLLVTDVLMPGMSGVDLAQTLLRAQMVSRVLFVSGYPNDMVRQQMSGVSGVMTHCLQKPFTPTELANKIEEVLMMQPTRADG